MNRFNFFFLYTLLLNLYFVCFYFSAKTVIENKITNKKIISVKNMVSFFDEVEKHFGKRCLYAALDLTKEADNKQIKRAYHKYSLLCHPDRSTEEKRDSDKEKFQILSKIHSVLSDKEKRAVYDDTGELADEDDILTQDRDWDAYWRLLFKKVSKKDIEQFESEYRHSERETDDLKKCYLEFEGI